MQGHNSAHQTDSTGKSQRKRNHRLSNVPLSPQNGTGTGSVRLIYSAVEIINHLMAEDSGEKKSCLLLNQVVMRRGRGIARSKKVLSQSGEKFLSKEVSAVVVSE